MRRRDLTAGGVLDGRKSLVLFNLTLVGAPKTMMGGLFVTLVGWSVAQSAVGGRRLAVVLYVLCAATVIFKNLKREWEGE